MINLQETFGHLYRISYDDAAKTDGKLVELQIIPCKDRRNHFFPFGIRDGEEKICLWIETPMLKKRLLGKFSEIKILNNGDREWILIFPVSIFLPIAEMAGAKKKRKLSDNHKEKLLSTSKKFRFSRHKLPVLSGQETKKGNEAYPSKGEDIIPTFKD